MGMLLCFQFYGLFFDHHFSSPLVLLFWLLLALGILYLWRRELFCLLRLVLGPVVFVLSYFLFLLLFSRGFFCFFYYTCLFDASLEVYAREWVWLEHLVRRLVDGVAQALVRAHLQQRD